LVTREGGDIFVNPMIKENMSVEMLGLVYSRLHYIHNSYEPVHKRFTISIKPKRLPKRFRSKALIGYVSEDGIIGKGGSWSEGYVTYRPRTLGPFLVIIDTVAPGIKPINVEPNADLSNSEEIRIKVSDPISGIKSYKGTIDGKWILLEYDYKEDLLVYTFDERINKGSHILELVVIDEKNNKSKLSLPFTR
ncbi:MAG: hypothetical protein IIA45_15540, partial [Bacteroidetes bacterium]|nr:hypothetical protein [Bacteroidota bacterium]